MHVLAVVDPAVPNVPAAHGVPMQAARPVRVVYVPDGQSAHVAAAAVVWPVGPKRPAAHAVPAHVDVPFTAEYVPDGHA